MKTKTIRHIPDDVWHAARLKVLEEGQTLGAWITEAIQEKLQQEDDMRLTDAQSKTLLDINCGERPRLKSTYNSRTIEALEAQGLIAVRDIDGETRVTTSGLDYLSANHPAKEDRAMSTQLHPNDVALNFENNGDVTMMPNDPDIPDQLVAHVDTDGDIHIEDDAPVFITHEFIMNWLEHTLSMTLELGDIWTPDACFMKAAGWDIDWTWDDASRSWIKED